MTIIGNLRVLGTYDGRKFDKPIDKSRRKTKEFDKTTARLSKSINALGISIAALGTGATIFANRFAKETLEADRFAKGIGVATSQLIAFQRVGSQLGVSTENINDAFLELNKRAGEAAQDGTGPLVAVLDKLNIGVQQFARLNPIQKMETLNQKMKALNVTTAEQQFLLDEAMGGAMDGLVGKTDELLAGVKAIDKALIETQTQDAVEFAKTWDNITRRLEKYGRNMVISVGPYVKSALDKLERMMFWMDQGLKDPVGQRRRQTSLGNVATLFSSDLGASYRATVRSTQASQELQARNASRMAQRAPQADPTQYRDPVFAGRPVVLQDANLGGGG